MDGTRIITQKIRTIDGRKNGGWSFWAARSREWRATFRAGARLDWSLALLCVSLVVPLKDIYLFLLHLFLHSLVINLFF